ncbi:MAG: hypothetical protein QME12_02015 [Nanoarchaeota archaeon]|nr:hypothetical protein [Nanoarchaeota archaeon]
MAIKDFIGKWRIYEMEEWDKDYLDEEVKAYISIEKNKEGDFHFGLVRGNMCGEFKKTSEGILFDFTWDGNEECDAAFGDGWMRITENGTAEGEIRFHGGDKSLFWAKRIDNNKTSKRKGCI